MRQSHRHAQAVCRLGQTSIIRPQQSIGGQLNSHQEVDIDIADAGAEKAMALDELQNLSIGRDGRRGEIVEGLHDLLARG